MLTNYINDERMSKVRVLVDVDLVWHFRDGLLKPLCRKDSSFEEYQLKDVDLSRQCRDCRDITERMYQGW